MATITANIGAQDIGARLDRWFLRRYPELTKGQFEKLLRSGQVRINKGRVRGDYRLQDGDQIRLPPQLAHIEPASLHRPHNLSERERDYWQKRLPAMILFEDNELIAINKPCGLATQGGTGIRTHLDGLLSLLVRDGEPTPHLVHRLDKDTSGVLLLAKNRAAAERLGRAFKERRISKLYWAITEATPESPQGTIRAALQELAAETHYRLLASADGKAWLACEPISGRTHQIRRHLALIDTPILGDRKYGKKSKTNRLYLHARTLRYGDKTFTAEPDDNFIQKLKDLKFSLKIQNKDEPLAL